MSLCGMQPSPGGVQALGCQGIMSPRTDFWEGLELDDIATHLQPGSTVGIEAAHFPGFEAVLNEESGELCHIPDLGVLDQPCAMRVIPSIDPEPLVDVTGKAPRQDGKPVRRGPYAARKKAVKRRKDPKDAFISSIEKYAKAELGQAGQSTKFVDNARGAGGPANGSSHVTDSDGSSSRHVNTDGRPGDNAAGSNAAHAAFLQAQVVQLARTMTGHALRLFLPHLTAAGVAVVDSGGVLSGPHQSVPGMYLPQVQQQAGRGLPSANPATGPKLDPQAVHSNWTPELVLTGAHQTAMLAEFYIQGYHEGLAAAAGAQTLAQPNHDSLLQLCNTLMRTRGVASQLEAVARVNQPEVGGTEGGNAGEQGVPATADGVAAMPCQAGGAPVPSQGEGAPAA